MRESLRNSIMELLSKNQFLVEGNENVNSGYMKLIVDSKKSITINDISKLAKSIRDSKKVSAHFPNGVKVEVSTPGIDSPLKKPFQYIKNIGRDILVCYLSNDNEEEKKINGTIVNADNQNVYIEVEREIIIIEYKKIVYAKLIISFG